MAQSENPKRTFFDYEQIELFGKCSLPVEDMSYVLKMPLERIQRLMAKENSKFYQSYRRGQAMTKLVVLQRQIAVATGEAQGNAPLLQHLGAILLGQNASKKPAENIQDSGEKPLFNRVVPSLCCALFCLLFLVNVAGSVAKSHACDSEVCTKKASFSSIENL